MVGIKAALEDMPLIVAEMFWLAYQAAHVVGMGIMQARSNATKEEVQGDIWLSATGYHADYVFGRMVKLTIKLNHDRNQIEVPDTVPMYDYQSWCYRYPTYQDLFNAAFASYKKAAS